MQAVVEPIGAIAGNDFSLAREHARNFEGCLVGLGSSGGKEEFINPLGQDFQ
jgi:hypothetical protein